ncbi:hypothetical protein HUJ05_010514 [Dendroctonus ponderosae]|nr:hypothetical protein HUJ05_010514 [Dendroctonus ponderosae]KAH1025883.1 hypothetical protein HUJ05_010514 [Dendroctonus ponderosae]
MECWFASEFPKQKLRCAESSIAGCRQFKVLLLHEDEGTLQDVLSQGKASNSDGGSLDSLEDEGEELELWEEVCGFVTHTLAVKLYLSPVETYCSNINYYIPDENNETKDFTDDAWTRLHMGRSMVALFIISFFAVFAAFCTGVTGCWRRSPGNITATAILMLLACLLSAGAMGLWHGVEYYEKEKQVGEEFYQQWSTVLRDQTRIFYDWGYMLAWAGVGWALTAAILFSGAAICLRGEREREEAINMQYLMPVYPQKQQYAYAGYPVPPQQYSGPYYTTGSAYGPYNY